MSLTICPICCVPTARGVYYAVPAENYFILTWMEDAEKAAAKVNSLKDEDDSLACIVDLTQEWTRAAE